MKITKSFFLVFIVLFISFSLFFLTFLYMSSRLINYYTNINAIKTTQILIKKYQNNVNSVIIYPVSEPLKELLDARADFEKKYNQLKSQLVKLNYFEKEIKKFDVSIIRSSSIVTDIIEAIKQISIQEDLLQEKGLIAIYNELSKIEDETSNLNIYFIKFAIKNRDDFYSLLSDINQGYLLLERDAVNRLNFLIFYTLALFIFLVSLSLIAFRFFTKRWRNQVIKESVQLLDYTKKISSGNLAASFTPSIFDEFNALYRAINESINYKDVLTQIKKNIYELDEIYRKTKNTLYDFQNKVNQYTEKIIKTSHLFEELTTSVLYFQKKAKDTKFVSLETKDRIQTSSSMVRQNIDDIQKLTTPATKIIEALKFITKITDETSLLSLNAAIESAKAGVKGKGFRVVASEVGKLAETSSQSTADIAKLAEEIIVIIQKINIESTDSIQALQAIEKSIEEVVKFFDEVVFSIEKETGETKSLLNSVMLINQLIEKTDKSIEEAIENSNNLSKELLSILQVVERFNLETKP